ncbi:MAG: sugar ABC transporter ATP-binding protein [bacterium]|nr:sugar ABC transporter ATP-binding protein [bacterium]
MNDTMLLKVSDLSKSYPGVQALDAVNFDLNAGEVHALVGENGAGKSTLIEILAGSIKPDDGKIAIGDTAYAFLDPVKSIEKGIQTVHQENRLVEEMSIAENMYLYHLQTNDTGFFSFKKCLQASAELLQSLGIDLPPQRKLGTLSPVEKKLVSIAKAFSRKANILILDEPTASLDEHGKNILFRIIREYTQKGLSVIYISHNLGEVFDIGARVTVLKDGKKIDTHRIQAITEDVLITEMIGRPVSAFYQTQGAGHEGDESDDDLKIENYSRAGVVESISLNVRKGEIFGLGGMVGSGRTEFARLLFGLDRKDSGKLIYRGKDITPRTPYEAIQHGIGYLTEDRKANGLILKRPIFENISLVELGKNIQLFINRFIEKEQTDDISRKLNIVTPSVKQLVRNLSGGNQQKVVLAKWIFAKADILIFDEPTVGIDVGAKAEIYHLMHELAGAGKSIIMISSDMPELISVSHRVGVMRSRRLVAILEQGEIGEENILKHSIGFEEGNGQHEAAA